MVLVVAAALAMVVSVGLAYWSVLGAFATDFCGVHGPGRPCERWVEWGMVAGAAGAILGGASAVVALVLSNRPRVRGSVVALAVTVVCWVAGEAGWLLLIHQGVGDWNWL